MSSSREHLDQIADFVIRSHEFAAHNELNIAFGKFMHEALNNRNDDVFRIVHSEYDFEVRIALHTVAAKILVSIRVCTAQRLEQGNSRTEARAPGRAAFVKEPSGRPKAKEVVPETT